MSGKLRTPAPFENDELIAQYFEKLHKRVNVANVTTLSDDGATVSNPPTQAEVQAIYDKVDELIAAFTTAETMDS